MLKLLGNIDYGVFFVILFIYSTYYISYYAWWVEKNHNEVQNKKISTKKYESFYSEEKVKNSAKFKLFNIAIICAFFWIKVYADLSERYNDNLYFSCGIIFPCFVFVAGLTTRIIINLNIWDLELNYIKEVEKKNIQSPLRKINIILTSAEQKSIFIVASIVAAGVSPFLFSFEITLLIISMFIGGIVWLDTDLKETIEEVKRAIMEFCKNRKRIVHFMIPGIVTIIIWNWTKYNLVKYGYFETAILLFVWLIIWRIWGYLIKKEKKEKERLDKEWQEIEVGLLKKANYYQSKKKK